MARTGLMESITYTMLSRRLKPHESTGLSVSVEELDLEPLHEPLAVELVDFIRSRPETLRQNVFVYDGTHEYEQRPKHRWTH